MSILPQVTTDTLMTQAAWAPSRSLESEVVRLRRLVEEQAGLIATLQQHALQDPLTGALNRRGFEAALRDVVSDYRRYGRPCAVLVLDMNGFKHINDTLGHAAGDALLQHLTRILHQYTRESDVVARTGGDEFTVILRENDEATARRKARELETVLALTPCAIGALEIAVHASIGCAALEDADNVDDWLATADAEMYARKKAMKLGAE
ncbi:MAG: GGDEF domain-containing protein [Alphaproteobacteria bacterium]